MVIGCGIVVTVDYQELRFCISTYVSLSDGDELHGLSAVASPKSIVDGLGLCGCQSRRHATIEGDVAPV